MKNQVEILQNIPATDFNSTVNAMKELREICDSIDYKRDLINNFIQQFDQ